MVVIFGALYRDVRCELRLRVEDRTLANNGLFLQIVIWMESCVIGMHTTSNFI